MIISYPFIGNNIIAFTCRGIGQCWRATRAANRVLQSDGRRCFITAFALFGSISVTLENKSDKLRGVGGSAPKSPRTSCQPLIVLVRREFMKIPYITFVVVIIHPVVYSSAYFIMAQSLDFDLVLHMPEKAFLGFIIPAVCLARHRLTKTRVIYQIN